MLPTVKNLPFVKKSFLMMKNNFKKFKPLYLETHIYFCIDETLVKCNAQIPKVR